MPPATIERTLTVRRLEATHEYVAAELLQERVWGAGDLGRSSLVDMLTAQESGGIVIGAFDGDELVGFVFSILGVTPWGQLKQASILMGVLPEHRGRGIGASLKFAQRDAALAAGIDLITWTFDPLVAVNANLNIATLGGASHEYLVNYYGDGACGLNSGLPTDRLLLQWNLSDTSELPTTRGIVDGSPRPLITWQQGDHPDVPVITDVDHGGVDASAFIPIPPRFGALKARDPRCAIEWRLATRGLFLDLFRRGFAAVDFRPGDHGNLPGYVLERPQW